jgi:hypothetical protein
MRGALVVSVVALVSSAALADDGLQPAPGTRVRITSSDSRLTGKIVAASPDALIVSVKKGREPVTVARDAITRFELGHRRTSGKGALRGAGIGLLAGGVGGAALGVALDSPDDWFSGGELAAGGAIVFGGAGALIGALVGAASPGERWETVPTHRVRVGLTPRIGRGRGLALSVSF